MLCVCAAQGFCGTKVGYKNCNGMNFACELFEMIICWFVHHELLCGMIGESINRLVGKSA